MFVILHPNAEEDGVTVVGPFADEDAAQAALDKFAEENADEMDVDDYEIVEVTPKLVVSAA